MQLLERMREATKNIQRTLNSFCVATGWCQSSKLKEKNTTQNTVAVMQYNKKVSTYFCAFSRVSAASALRF